jgi:hypothetical protein
MQKARLVNFSCWVLNALLGMAIIVFLYRFILFPARTSVAEDIEGDVAMETPAPVPEVPKREVAEYKPIWETAFKAPEKPVDPAAAGAGAAVGPPADQLFTIKLVTIVENAPELGSVVVEKKGGEQRFLVIGDRWLDAGGPGTCLELREVRLQLGAGDVKEYRAAFLYNGQAVELKYVEGVAGTSSVDVPKGGTRPRPDATTNPTDFKSYRDPNDPNRWFIDTREREYAFQNEAIVFNQIDMRPYVQDGVTTGMLISRVDGGSLPDRRGLKVGDVVQTINGVKVDSIEAVKRIIQDNSIRSADSVAVELERAGQKMSVTFQIFVPQ